MLNDVVFVPDIKRLSFIFKVLLEISSVLDLTSLIETFSMLVIMYCVAKYSCCKWLISHLWDFLFRLSSSILLEHGSPVFIFFRGFKDLFILHIKPRMDIFFAFVLEDIFILYEIKLDPDDFSTFPEMRSNFITYKGGPFVSLFSIGPRRVLFNSLYYPSLLHWCFRKCFCCFWGYRKQLFQ